MPQAQEILELNKSIWTKRRVREKHIRREKEEIGFA